MIKNNYANAYKEVLVVLEQLVEEDYNRIPQKYINFLRENCNNNYDFQYDSTKTFEEQNLSNYTKYILFGLFEKYGTTDLQKEIIKNFRKGYYNQVELEKREKYNPDDIFKNANKVQNTVAETSENNTNTALVEYKESFFTKFKTFIFKILHINK